MQHDLASLADVPRLTEWLDAHVPELGNGPLTTELLHGGTSNVVLTLDRGGPQMVLRRPPAVPPPGTERGVLREARVLTALNRTDVPHPMCYGTCEDKNVIGMPFYVMERVDGWAGNLRGEKIHNEPPFDKMPYEYGLAYAIVGGLVQLANVDYKAIGLEGFGKPDNFLERQVDRWASQLASYKDKYDGYEGRHLEGYDEVEAWLRANARPTDRIGIIHGDVATTNMMFHHGPPARLAAMIDWELSTIGDPMLDMGWLCGGLRDERFPDLTSANSLIDVNNAPTKQALGQYYCAGTGRSMEEFDYFCVLAGFKIGCVIEYKVAQAAAGILPKDVGEFFRKSVDGGFRRNAEFVRRISAG
ncbi:MAG: phosphotransferase family protein [Novosphingobium sp.]|nr:phosphotransferase family protein [Novosphingobium sp.]